MTKFPRPMKMYVWSPASVSDYYSGVVCAVAESKHAAIELAVEARHPLRSAKRGMTTQERAALIQTNQDILVHRNSFRDELRREKPRVIRRGAIIEFGGG